jgi:methionyl-tRNA formyltransferase
LRQYGYIFLWPTPQNWKKPMAPKNGTVLFLGYSKDETNLIGAVEEVGFVVKHTAEKVSDFSEYDVVVSFGYRHIIPERVIRTAKRPIVNLHISYLPYNRGSHPNFWSFVDRTPSGVSIHEIDSGIDTGPILFQRLCSFDRTETTFSSTYKHLTSEIESLFIENISSILMGSYHAFPQKGRGTYHSAKDLPKWVTSWDINIAETIAKVSSGAADEPAL